MTTRNAESTARELLDKANDIESCAYLTDDAEIRNDLRLHALHLRRAARIILTA